MQITVEEVVRCHLENSTQTVDQLLKNITDNLEELARSELASQLGQTCFYGLFNPECDCNFCGGCIKDGEFKNFQDKLESQGASETYSDMCHDYNVNVLGHPY